MRALCPIWLYGERDVAEAIENAADGGRSLHVSVYCGPTKGCFRQGSKIGHLFDQDIDRLRCTAIRLGLRRVFIHHRGSAKQHIDLAGRPLARAIAECREAEMQALARPYCRCIAVPAEEEAAEKDGMDLKDGKDRAWPGR